MGCLMPMLTTRSRCGQDDVDEVLADVVRRPDGGKHDAALALRRRPPSMCGSGRPPQLHHSADCNTNGSR
jgi:hypothetical protein